MIEDLLSLSRLEQADESSIKQEVRPLAEIVEYAVTTCSSKAVSKHITLQTDIDHSVTARFNPVLMGQALVNLVDNAVKYSSSGKTVRIAIKASNEKAIVSVSDEGMGITASEVPRIFERFYRVDKARSRDLGGTGLGLSIVKHIVQAHCGELTVDSSPGKGSIFSIILDTAESSQEIVQG